MTRSLTATTLTLAALAMAKTAGAGVAPDAIFSGTVDTDWFIAGNWSTGLVPNPSTPVFIRDGNDCDALIANGGSGIICHGLYVARHGSSNPAGGTTTTLTSDVDLRSHDSIEVGNNFNTGTATGLVFVTDADIEILSSNDDFDIGRTNFEPTAEAAGGVSITNGNLINCSDLTVGRSSLDGGNATGIFEITNGDVISNPNTFGDLEIATRSGNLAGIAMGAVIVNDGTVSNFDDLDLGQNTDPNGATQGVFELHRSSAIIEDLVSMATGEGPNQSADVLLDSAFLSANRIESGSGATFTFEIKGTTRASQSNVADPNLYGAMDFTGVADVLNEDFFDLDGTLALDFMYAPNPGDTFDLVNLTTPGEVFNTIPAAINIDGLPSHLGAAIEITPAGVSAGESIQAQVISMPQCDGDADANGVVDVGDIAFVVFRLGNATIPGAALEGDADGNGIVDTGDISFVIFRLGNSC